jgi:hypothetical protein
MKFYYPIQFPVKLLKDDLDLETLFTRSRHGIFKEDYNDWLHHDFIDFFQDTFNFKPWCLFFIAPANYEMVIHTDGYVTSDSYQMHSWAINYVWNGENSVMRWYKSKTVFFQKSVDLSPASTDHQRWTKDQVELLDSATICDSHIVRTDIPHDVYNYDRHKSRYCLSVRSDVSPKNKFSYRHALKLFKNLIKVN